VINSLSSSSSDWSPSSLFGVLSISSPSSDEISATFSTLPVISHTVTVISTDVLSHSINTLLIVIIASLPHRSVQSVSFNVNPLGR